MSMKKAAVPIACIVASAAVALAQVCPPQAGGGPGTGYETPNKSATGVWEFRSLSPQPETRRGRRFRLPRRVSKQGRRKRLPH